MQNDTPKFTPNDRHLLVPPRDTSNSAVSAMRSEVDKIYATNPPNQVKKQPVTIQPIGHATQQAPVNPQSPYERTHQENFDWRNYHSAWQNYYQQYYQQYYTYHLHAERLKLHADKAAQAAAPAPQEPQVVTGTNTSNDQKSKIAKLKHDITDTVKAQAQKARKSHHFIPIFSAVMVGLVFIFLQFNSVLVAHVKAYVSPGNLSNESLILDPTSSANVGPEPKLIIPKINVDVPVDYSVTGLTEAQIQTSLRDGATWYNLPGANAKPGQNGNTVILGHSSNDIFNQGKYKFVFVLLDRLRPGDTFYLNYEGKRFIYKVTDIKVIDPTQVSALQIGTSKPMATLVTCTPPGTALKRLVIFGEQISPDPGGAVASEPQSAPAQENTVLPGNEPNWLDNIWNFLF
ncbi:MAG TPA: sortase [Candidatus Saccharimonadales bacterium]|nr:sortase [Candidatus Saccharimonadales bacterium]